MDRRKGAPKILSKAIGRFLITKPVIVKITYRAFDIVSKRAVRSGFTIGLISTFALWHVGCANYATRVRGPRDAMEFGRFDAAILDLRALVDRNDNDQLLYLMDLGLAYHAAGLWKDAITTFLRADKLAEIEDYTSISQEVGSVILNDSVKFYKGEYFEKLLINTYLAIDYAMSKQWDDALVESRRVNQKIDRMVAEGGMAYERNGFAKYLAAVLFEARREYNDAFVDYRQLRKWNVRNDYLEVGLLRMADKLKASQEFGEYAQEFGRREFKVNEGQGELILILEQGRGPIKVPSEVLPIVPRFQRRSYNSERAVIRVGRREAVSAPFFDVESTAIGELDRRIAGIVMKKIGGVVAKEIIANEIYKKNEALGILSWLVLRGTDQADLRSWSTLPARFHFARLVVPAGRHRVELDSVSVSGYQSRVHEWSDIEVKNRELVLLNYRMVN